MSAHLEPKLIEKYNIRSLPVRKGDTIKIVRGDKKIKGFEGKVIEVDLKSCKIAIEGVTSVKADRKEVQRYIHPSNVIITKLDLSDPLRRKRIEKKGKLTVPVEKIEIEEKAREKPETTMKEAVKEG
jgi:large subunit ribosomal protein L24